MHDIWQDVDYELTKNHTVEELACFVGCRLFHPLKTILLIYAEEIVTKMIKHTSGRSSKHTVCLFPK